MMLLGEVEHILRAFPSQELRSKPEAQSSNATSACCCASTLRVNRLAVRPPARRVKVAALTRVSDAFFQWYIGLHLPLAPLTVLSTAQAPNVYPKHMLLSFPPRCASLSRTYMLTK